MCARCFSACVLKVNKHLQSCCSGGNMLLIWISGILVFSLHQVSFYICDKFFNKLSGFFLKKNESSKFFVMK